MKRSTSMMRVAFLTVTLLVSLLTFAQTRTISGKVTSKSGEPLPGVSVTAKGSTIGTQTDLNGNFTLQVPQNTRILSFSSVGYTQQDYTVGAAGQANISLSSGGQSLEDV